jgi:hypothetical protein
LIITVGAHINTKTTGHWPLGEDTSMGTMMGR